MKYESWSRRTLTAMLIFYKMKGEIVIKEQIREVYSSSSKLCGSIQFSDGSIKISNGQKPLLEITDKDDVQAIEYENYDYIEKLYNKYELTVGELAALYNTNYHYMYKTMKELGIKLYSSKGRRNSSYGQKFSEERRKHIGQSRVGVYPEYLRYERTPEIRKRISETLKEGYRSGRIVMNVEALSQAWKDGKYDNSPMGHGIQGYVNVSKNTKDKDIFFRSLLELKYIIDSENNDSVSTITSEPYHIKLDDDSTYTPDFLINEKYLVELKPKNHLKWRKDSQNNRFEKEVEGAENFCKEHGYDFKVIYDSDIDFETGKYKRYLLSHPEIIEKYNIRFNKELKAY